MAGAALAATAFLIRVVRRARAAGDMDASTALTFGIGALISLPVAAVAVTGGVERRPDAFGELVAIFPGWYQTANRAGLVLIAGLAALLLVRAVNSGRAPVHAAGLFAVALWMVAHLSSGLQGERLLTLAGGALLICLMASTVLPRGRGGCVGVGLFGVSLAVSSGLLGVLDRDAAFIAECEEACGGLGFTGVFPNENLLGLALVASIPFAYLGFRGRARLWLCLYLAGMAVATGSRTAIVAAVVIVAALAVLRPRLDNERQALGRAVGAAFVLAVAVLASVYVAQHDWDATALTDRPHLWQVASEYIEDSPLFGYGSERWAGLAQSSEIPLSDQRSAHNQWMDVLFVAGWAGALLLLGMVAAAVWSAGPARPGVLLVLATIMMLGTTEGAWSIGTLDLLSFSLIALILTGPSRKREVSVRAAEGTVRARRAVGEAVGRSRLTGRPAGALS